ncbi:MAG: hypothetical protein Q8N05_02080 [Bacteroidota bacterium]|nr:hypothetical protein [Bacteroidota bacterium]
MAQGFHPSKQEVNLFTIKECLLKARDGILCCHGAENIFRLFRVEAVWRVRTQSILGAPAFGLRAKFEIKL